MAAKVSRVFVLGAGASAFAGYPLAYGLLDFLKQEPILEVKTQELANEVLYKLHHAALQLERETRKKWGLEVLLTHLDLYGTVGKLRVFTGDWTDSDRMKVSRVIAHQFQWHQYKIHRKVWGSAQSNLQLDVNPGVLRAVAEAWADFLQPGDTIVSFNWDLLHESILWQKEKWNYVDGYGFVLPRADTNEPLSKVKIYKLHGSVNWVQESETDPISEIEFAGDFFFGSSPPSREFPPRTTGLDSGRKLILPTYLKDISRNIALLDIWQLAFNAVKEATEVWVIGYSLNPADHPARMLLGSALRANRAVEGVNVVSPRHDAWPEFLGRLGKNLSHTASRFEDCVTEQRRN